jgi:exodeoxyribonuclease VII large subunit
MGSHGFRDVYTVSRLTSEVRLIVEGHYPALWIEGEVSNLARPASGHLYFSLKDATAQVRCAMFRGRGPRPAFVPENGMSVIARARASLYEPRGDFQLIVEHLEPAGEGALRAAFEALAARLEAEGLFDPARKRALPRLPRAIGVVTSPSGAALRDVLAVLARRWPALPVVLYPCLVQGREAAPSIVQALAAAGRRAEVDLLLLVRGGGSLEDLWPFNEEAVARAIAACPLPVVSGVGHETDLTIADRVADLRAPTPSAAAELACPDARALLGGVRQSAARLTRAMQQRLQQLQARLALARARLLHPARRLEQLAQRLDEASLRARHALVETLHRQRLALERLGARLAAQHPAGRLQRARERLASLARRLRLALAWLLAARRERWRSLASALVQVGPEATLARGYAIVRDPETRAVLRDATRAAPGQRLAVTLARGALAVRVEAIDEDGAAVCPAPVPAPTGSSD